MNFKLYTMLIGVALLINFQSCVEYRDDPNCKYMSLEDFRAKGVEILPPQEIDKSGKIYIYKNTLLVQEVDKGIHLIDNKDKNNPTPKAFIKIMGNMDMAVKEGYLYIDSYMDLVVVDINNLENIKIINRVKETFTYDPYQSSGRYYYDCGEYNASKGILLRTATGYEEEINREK